MEKTIEDIVLTVKGVEAYGSVTCDFIIDYYSPALLGVSPDNCHPDETEKRIKIISWEFTDEDGGEVEVNEDVIQSAIDGMDWDGEFDKIWEKVIDSLYDIEEDEYGFNWEN
jgi:hypothetical protein